MLKKKKKERETEQDTIGLEEATPFTSTFPGLMNHPTSNVKTPLAPQKYWESQHSPDYLPVI